MQACAVLGVMLGKIDDVHPDGPDGSNLMTEEADGPDN
jgi:hypothetical protein